MNVNVVTNRILNSVSPERRLSGGVQNIIGFKGVGAVGGGDGISALSHSSQMVS